MSQPSQGARRTPAPLDGREDPSQQQQQENYVELLVMESPKRKVSLGADQSPRGYLVMTAITDRDDDNDAVALGRSRSSVESNDSLSSMSSRSRQHKFACQFDPSVKNGRALVLKFDASGVGTFEEMTRASLLRLTHDAAMFRTPATAEVDESISAMNSEHGTVVGPAGFKTSSRRLSFRRLKPDSNGIKATAQQPHATICDVQRVHARDIRKLDNAFAVSNEAAFTVRKQAILLNADPLRAIIMRDSCLVFVPDGADSLLSVLKARFSETMQHGSAASVAYEFKALEALLATLSQNFETEYEKRAPVISAVLDRLARGKVGARELEQLRTFKNTTHEFETQVDGVRRALMEILDNEEDLRLLYLTKLHADPGLLGDLWSFDSEEAEVLIENYLQDIFSTRTKASLMQHRIQNTESLVMLKLDSMRNYLLGVDLVFSLTAISLSVGTYVTGAFGMNLNSNLQDASGWFWGVVATTVGLFVVLTGAGVQFFREKGILSWRDESTE